MRHIDSKDVWYVAICSAILSLAVPGILECFALLVVSIISFIIYIFKANQEIRISRIDDLNNRIRKTNNLFLMLSTLDENLKKLEKPKTPTRKKTSSRRIRRK